MVVEANYEDGVLRPTRPLLLRAGEHVRIIVLREGDPARWDLQRIAQAATKDDVDLTETGLGAWVDELEREDRRP